MLHSSLQLNVTQKLQDVCEAEHTDFDLYLFYTAPHIIMHFLQYRQLVSQTIGMADE